MNDVGNSHDVANRGWDERKHRRRWHTRAQTWEFKYCKGRLENMMLVNTVTAFEWRFNIAFKP
jgi:hypothetical protein